MMLHSSQIEATKGVDEMYDAALAEFFTPYHMLVDLICRVAVDHQSLSEPIINLSAMVAIEGPHILQSYGLKSIILRLTGPVSGLYVIVATLLNMWTQYYLMRGCLLTTIISTSSSATFFQRFISKF
ncbi:uncharacterized protein LOC134265303 [Saccostrea cucullata]|uniref:uncharacterized protein LOC134265303 n=1 Tax=Saccostrea cuccullata TaxID=36930 RepID=UPI002ED43D94